MDNIQVAPAVGVRFSKVGKIYHFDSRHLENIKVGDVVRWRPHAGWQLGRLCNWSKTPIWYSTGQ